MQIGSPRALVRPRWRSVLAVIATYGGDTLYATLIFFLAALLWPSWPTWRLASVALGFCYVIELSPLNQARSGAAVGTASTGCWRAATAPASPSPLPTRGLYATTL